MPDVDAILEAVRSRGADAVVEWTERLDGVRLNPEDLVYDPFAEPVSPPPAEDQAAIDFAIDRVWRFHHLSRPKTAVVVEEPGLRLEERWVPLRRVGVYAPNGLFPLLSSLIMCAVPALAAGVDTVVAAISPRHQSRHDPYWNYTLRRLGIRTVLAAGGAQAIAALAYGLPGLLEPVELVAGPGNAWVAAAKQALFSAGVIGIDLWAGPSEVLVIADRNAPPEWVALDLLAQAEHAPDATAICVSWQPDALQAIQEAVQQAIADAPEGAEARGQIRWELVQDPAAAVTLANRIAPEHLALVGPEAEALAPAIRTAGALFLGPLAGQALGDYVAGPSHVLPTQGTGRFASGLSTRTFMRRMSVIQTDSALNPDYLDHGARLATREGLYFHARSLMRRRGERPDNKEASTS
ncbi:MAG: histidinol dehydrogenase [Firmicutes bacterium]|nr:histidinol dehydrogenase [Alicyclobacillaceae bacterium]MCL6496585.1 histidinol dehydrogenase [Bacillota bacterium]